MEKYRVLEKIGAGSHGEVFVVEERTSFARECGSSSGEANQSRRRRVIPREARKRTWVMKVIPLPEGKENKASCLKEAATMLKLSHPCIVACKESFIDPEEGIFCIAMERCTGGELRHHIAKQREQGKLLAEEQVLDWLLQLLLAVEYLHHKNVLHRDLKSENVFLRDPSDFPHGNLASVQLGDFGISRVLKHADETANSFVGTPLYMSPELIRNEPYNHKSDIWALGCILYEMMCLRKPFEAETVPDLVYLVLKTDYPEPSACYSPEVCFLLSKMLEKDSSNRPSAATLLSFPLLKERATKFLAKCREFAEDAQAESEELRSPTFVRRYEIHKEVLHQARRLGLRLSLSNVSAACASACASSALPLPGKESPPKEESSMGEEGREGSKRFRTRSPLRGWGGIRESPEAGERMDTANEDREAPGQGSVDDPIMDPSLVGPPRRESPLRQLAKIPPSRGARPRSSGGLREGREGTGERGSTGGSGDPLEGIPRRWGSEEIGPGQDWQRSGSGKMSVEERRSSCGSGGLVGVTEEQRRPMSAAQAGTRRAGLGNLRPVPPLSESRRQQSWSPADLDTIPPPLSGMSPHSPFLPVAGMSPSPFPPPRVSLQQPPRPRVPQAALAQECEGERREESRGRRRMSADMGRTEKRSLGRRMSHDLSMLQESSDTCSGLHAVSPPQQEGLGQSPSNLGMGGGRVHSGARLQRGTSTGLRGTNQKLPPRASTQGRPHMRSDPLMHVDLDDIRDLQGGGWEGMTPHTAAMFKSPHTAAMFKSQSGDSQVEIRAGEELADGGIGELPQAGLSTGPRRAKSPLHRGNSVGTVLVEHGREAWAGTGKRGTGLRRGSSVGLSSENGLQVEPSRSPPGCVGPICQVVNRGSNAGLGGVGCVQEDGGSAGDSQTQREAEADIPRPASAPGRRRRASNRVDGGASGQGSLGAGCELPPVGRRGRLESWNSTGQGGLPLQEERIPRLASPAATEASSEVLTLDQPCQDEGPRRGPASNTVAQGEEKQTRPRSPLARGTSVEPLQHLVQAAGASQGRLARGNSTGALLQPGVGSVTGTAQDQRHSPHRLTTNRTPNRTPNRTLNCSPIQQSKCSPDGTPTRSPNQDQLKPLLHQTTDFSPGPSLDHKAHSEWGERSTVVVEGGKSLDEKGPVGPEFVVRGRTRSSSTEIEEVEEHPGEGQVQSRVPGHAEHQEGNNKSQQQGSKSKSSELQEARSEDVSAPNAGETNCSAHSTAPTIVAVEQELNSTLPSTCSDAWAMTVELRDLAARPSSAQGPRPKSLHSALPQSLSMREQGHDSLPLSGSLSGLSPRPSAKGFSTPEPSTCAGGPKLARSRSRSPVSFRLPFIGSPWSSKAASSTPKGQNPCVNNNTPPSEEGEKGAVHALRAMFARLQVSPEETSVGERGSPLRRNGSVSPGGTFGPPDSPLMHSPTSIIARSFARLSPRLRPKLACFSSPSVEDTPEGLSLSAAQQDSDSGSRCEQSESGNSVNLDTSLSWKVLVPQTGSVQASSGDQPVSECIENKERERDSEDSDSSWLREVMAGMQQLPRATSAPTQETQPKERELALQLAAEDVRFDDQSWRRLAEAAATVRKGAFQKEAREHPVISLDDTSPSITSPCTPREDADMASPHMRHLLAKAPLSRVFGPARRRHERRPPKTSRKKMGEC